MDTQFNQGPDTANCVDSDYVTINGFTFCNRHGLEVCEKCPMDSISDNNSTIHDILASTLTEEEMEKKWKGDDRTPFSVTKQWTRVGSGQPGCIDHKQVGCSECFNWGDKILSDIQGKKKTKRAARKGKDKSTRLE